MNVSSYLSLLTPSEKRLVSSLGRDTAAYYDLTRGQLYDVSKIIAYHDRMISKLEKVSQAKNPAVFLAAEMAIISVDQRELTKVIEQYKKDGEKIYRELKADMTSLDQSFWELDRALTALVIRHRDVELYHAISDISRPERELDENATSRDVIRKNTRSQATRLENMAKGSSRTELGRKEQRVVGTRRQNMIACESRYKSQQLHIVQNRNKNRPHSVSS